MQAARSTTTRVRHVTPAFRTFAGDGCLADLPKELARAGVRRAVLISSPSVLKHDDAVGPVRDALGDRLVGEFGGVQEHSPVPVVEQARQLIQDCGADGVVALGGGSAVVTARAATILAAEGRDVRELCTRREPDGSLKSPRLTAPKMPQWIVPTTPTTAYAKAGSAVRDPRTGERLALFDPAARACGVFLDPAVALTAPPRLVSSAALNALSMAIEGLLSRRGDPLTDALLMQAVRTTREWLPAARDEPDEAGPRIQLMLAALMSGQGSDHTGGGVAQALSHALGPRSDAANGVVEAILLPHAIGFVGEEAPDRLEVLATALGLRDASLGAVVAALEEHLLNLGTPRRLRDVGVSPTGMAEAVDHAVDDWALATASRVPTRAQALDLVSAAW